MPLLSSTATSTSSIPQQVAANYNTAIATAGAAANQPWQQYSADPNAFVAGLNTTQQAGIANTNASAGQAQPYFNAAQSALGAGVNQAMPFVYGGGQDVNAQQIGGQQIGQFMSPYLGSVYSAMLAGQGQQNAQQQSALNSGAIRAGAFGGDRAGIGQANLAYQQNLANAQTNANMLNTGYGQALGAAQQQQGVNLAAQQANRAAQAATGQSLYGMGMGTSQQLGALGTGAQTAGLQGAAAQMGAGAAQQKTSQDALTAMYNQFLQSQAYPFQTSQFYTNAVGSLGPLFGGTTTTQTPGLFAARGGSIRGAYAGGGLIPSSMGGGVGYEHAGEGYADGGMPGGWSDYFQNALGASGFSPPTTYTPAPNQGGYTQAPGQSAYTQTPMPTYSHVPAGLGAAAADYGNIFSNLPRNTAAPSAQQQYSDSQLHNVDALRSPLVHAPEVKKDDTANPVAAPSGLAGMPYAGTSESGVGGAGQNMGANAPGTGTGTIGTSSFTGDVKGMLNALGDIITGGSGWGIDPNTIGGDVKAGPDGEWTSGQGPQMGENETKGGSQIEAGSQGDSGYGGAGDHEARGGRIHRTYGGYDGLNLSLADQRNMQAMRTENSGLFPGAPQGYKPPVDNRMQPGLGRTGIPPQGHPSQPRFPRPVAPSPSPNTVGGLIDGFSGAKDFYNNVSGDNPDYLNAAKTASSALGLATGGTADRGHYSTAGGVYSSEGRESAIPGYSPELGIPDVLTPSQQRASNAPASNGGGGGGLGDVLKIAGAVLPFLLKRGGAVGDRHEYADGGLAGGRHGYATDGEVASVPTEWEDFLAKAAAIKAARTAAPPAFMPAPEKPIGEVIPPIHSISQDDLNAHLKSVGTNPNPKTFVDANNNIQSVPFPPSPDFLTSLRAFPPGTPQYSAQHPETLRYSAEAIRDEVARRRAYPAGSSNTTGNDIMQMGEGSNENTPPLPSSLNKISSYQQQFSEPRDILGGSETGLGHGNFYGQFSEPKDILGAETTLPSNPEGNAPVAEQNPVISDRSSDAREIAAQRRKAPDLSLPASDLGRSGAADRLTASDLGRSGPAVAPPKPGLVPNNAFDATPVAAIDNSSGTTAPPQAPAAGLGPRTGAGSGASPFQKLQNEPLSWWQRNQDLISMIGGGLEGIGRGKNLLGMVLGGAGGAARGYTAGQKALSAQAYQEAQTEREAAGAAQANVQTAEIPANAATKRFTDLAATYKDSLMSVDGRLFVRGVNGMVPFSDWDGSQLVGGPEATAAAAALRKQFPAGAFVTGSGAGNTAGGGAGNIDNQDYNATTRLRESGSSDGRYDLVHNPSDPNGAYGAYGFRKNTWASVRQTAAQQGITLPDFETLKTMPASQSRAIQDQAQSIFTKSNSDYLTQNGIEPSKAALATAHYQGAAGAAIMLKAPSIMTAEGYASQLPGLDAAGKQSVVAQLHAQGVYNMGQAQQMAQQGWVGRVGQGGRANATTQPTSLSPEALQQAKADVAANYNLPTDARIANTRAATEERTIITNQAREARLQGPVINEFAKAIAAIPSSGPLSGGPTNKDLVPLASYFNSALRAAGFSVEKNPGLFFDPKVIDAKTYLDKLKITLASTNAQAGNERSFAALSALSNAIPSGDMSTAAANHLLSTMYVAKQRSIDEDVFHQAYGAAAKNQPMPGNAARLFPYQPGHSSQDYEKDRAAIEALLNQPFASGQSVLSAVLTGKAPNGKTISPDLINQHFGRNVTQYILGQ